MALLAMDYEVTDHLDGALFRLAQVDQGYVLDLGESENEENRAGSNLRKGIRG